MLTVRPSDGETGFSTDDLALVESIARAAYDEARAAMPTVPAEVVLLVSTGEWVIPESGELGRSLACGKVEWIVDPAREGGIAATAERELRSTMLHELHHQARGAYIEESRVRWVFRVLFAGKKPENRFISFVVTEGLANAFARDTVGRRFPWAEYPDEPTSEQWLDELLRLPAFAKYEHWMYYHPDGRRWIGYRIGTFIADRAIAASGRTAADLATTSTSEVLRLAGISRK